MRKQLLAVLLAGAWACVVAGCGGSDSGAGDKDQFIAQLCAEFADCCEAAGRPSDGAQCRALYGAFTPASGYDQAMAQACLDEVRAVQNACDTSSVSTPSCRKVFATSGGTKKPGESCEDDDDCAAPESGQAECVSDFVNQASVRQCQVQLPGTVGSAPCVGTVDGNITIYSGSADGIPLTGYLCNRADGLTCDGQTGACESLAAVGEACAGQSQCVPSAYCAVAESVCKQRLALGAACEDDDQCLSSAYCEPGGKACAARRATGQACTINAECESDDCTNQKCAADNDLSLAFLCGTN